jgi:hypothetical protein
LPCFFIGLLALFPICSADADDRWISESTALQTKILKKNSGKVPFPFEDFDRFKVGYENLKVLIPNGRSLQKKSTDLKHPRIINAMGEEIFLGYSPKSKSVEIISLNETELRFDFYEVKNYESGKTLIPTRANTALCFSCHQHEGPIFSRFPWSEAAHPGGQLMDKVVEKYPGVQKYHGAYLVAPYYSSSFQAAPAKIDIAIRHANQRLQTLKACAAICKNDYACKKVVMKALLEKMAGPENPKTVEELKKYVIPVWPSDGFQYASSILPSRKPFDGSFGKNGSIERIYDRSGG